MNNHIALGVLGISHKTAPVEIREQVALDEGEQKFAIQKIINDFEANGVMVLSTCNRTEFYVSIDTPSEKFQLLRNWLDDFKDCTHYTNHEIAYEKYGLEAARHFFNVVCGIDSQIVGELQITGQVKDSYNFAHDLEATDAMINKMYNYGMQVKKVVRNETFLSDGTISVSFAGVELARKIFSDLSNQRILMLGAGKTAELAAFHFMENQVKSINVVNRTLSKAKDLADKFNGKAYPLDDLETALKETDIVISATSSTDYVITKDLMAGITRKRNYEPIFLIDLAIPRDIDPGLEQLNNIYLYNLDDLNGIVEKNLEKRRREIPKASRMVSEVLDEFQKWLSTNSMSTIIGKLKQHFELLSANELAKLKKQYPENGYQKEIDDYTQSIVNKLVRQHMKILKKNVSDPEKYQQHIDMIFKIYEIDLE